jgi:hypothetical protein
LLVVRTWPLFGKKGKIMAEPFFDPNRFFPASDPVVIAWDYWKDVLSGKPPGTSNGERLATEAKEDAIKAGANAESAQQTYQMVLAQATPDVLYPPELKSKLIAQIVMATAVAVVGGIFLYKHL